MATTWTPESKNATDFADSPGKTASRTASTGTGIGLLLTLTHAVDSTVTFKQFDTGYTEQSINATDYTKESKSATDFTKESINKTDWS